MTDYQALIKALGLKEQFEENIRNLHVPRKHRGLTVDTAKWFLSNAGRSNRPSQLLDAMRGYCGEYLDIVNKKGTYHVK